MQQDPKTARSWPRAERQANKCSNGQCAGRAKSLSLHKFYVNTGHNKTNGVTNGCRNGTGEEAAAA